MKEFKVNDYITLRMENDKTNIYVSGKRFRQCIRLVLNIPIRTIGEYANIESIDDAAEIYDKYLYQNRIVQGPSARRINTITYSIIPEEEFKAHCSNIQVWAESGYDTRLLHRNLAFPLLKRLTEAGDPHAKRIFKSEIAERFASGHPPVMNYLIMQGFFRIFDKEELNTLLHDIDYKKLYASSLRILAILGDKKAKQEVKQSLHSNEQKLYRRLKKGYARFIRIKNHETEYRIFNILNKISTYLNLNKNIRNTAAYYYKKILKNEKKVINNISLIAFCIFYAVRKEGHNTPITITEISNGFQNFGHRVNPRLILRDGIKYKRYLAKDSVPHKSEDLEFKEV